MDQATLQQVRATPLFAGLTDAQLECIEPGEVIELPRGTVLVADGDRYPYFFVVLEGEVRIVRDYDKQTILMAVLKPGTFTGEITLLLDIPWISTVRVAKPARLFRLDQDNFWRMLSMCRSVAKEVFQSAASKMRNLEGYSQQREKLASLGTMAAGLAHELNNSAAAARRAAAHLHETAENVQSFLSRLAKCLEPEHWQHLISAAQEAADRKPTQLDHLSRSDGAETVGKWLETHGIVS